MSRSSFILVGGRRISVDIASNASLQWPQKILGTAHAVAERPRCVCRLDVEEHPTLAIRKINGRYFLARIPDSGLTHHSECRFYGETTHREMVPAIERRENGTENIHVSFTLSSRRKSKHQQRRVESIDAPRYQSVRPVDHQALGIDTLLNHLLTLTSALSPQDAVSGLSWRDLKWNLLDAAKAIEIEGTPLTDLIFIPSAYQQDKRDEQALLCNRVIQKVSRSKEDRRTFALLLAPISSIKLAKHDYLVKFRHLPRNDFWFSRAACIEFMTRHAAIIPKIDVHPYPLALFTVDVSSSGNFQLREGALISLT